MCRNSCGGVDLLISLAGNHFIVSMHIKTSFCISLKIKYLWKHKKKLEKGREVNHVLVWGSSKQMDS